MIALDVEFLPKHDIGYLINLIATKDFDFESYYEQAIKLTEYSVKIRYPDIIIQPTKDELEEAINTADLFREMILKKATMLLNF